MERLDQSNPENSSRRDFIYRFLQAKEKHSETLNNLNMLGFVGSNLQAGSDTTAIVLRTIKYQVLKNPEIAVKMRKELDSAAVIYPMPFQNVSSAVCTAARACSAAGRV